MLKCDVTQNQATPLVPAVTLMSATQSMWHAHVLSWCDAACMRGHGTGGHIREPIAPAGTPAALGTAAAQQLHSAAVCLRLNVVLAVGAALHKAGLLPCCGDGPDSAQPRCTPLARSSMRDSSNGLHAWETAHACAIQALHTTSVLDSSAPRSVRHSPWAPRRTGRERTAHLMRRA